MVALIALTVLLHRAADAVRGSPVREVAFAGGTSDPRLTTSTFLNGLATLAEVQLGDGHTVEILTDESFFGRLLPELRAAQRSITIMGYSCGAGRLGDQLAEILAERSRAGVRILFLGDGFGCRGLVRSIRRTLEEAGVQVAVFRPVRWHTLHRAQHRMHARSVVVDGVTAYTGGFGIDDKWAFDQEGEPLWRETNARVTGPAVRQIQAAVLAAWAEATGVLWVGDAFLPPAADLQEGDVLAGYLYSAPGIGTTPAERYLALTLAATERTLFIANSYFVPTPLMRRLLLDASRRGVDVRILLPGPRTDLPSVRYAGRGFYGELLAGGVRIFEYQPSMMHAKTLVVDGTWISVGSLNFDNRSLRLNDEAALLVWDVDAGAVMDSLFMADLGRSREITLDDHRTRAFTERLLERVARLGAPLL